MSDVAVALFTRDLRVHDNPVLTAAARSDRVVPLVVLDEGLRGFYRPNRTRFLVDCLRDLRDALRDCGANLVVREGEVTRQVRQVAAEAGAATVPVAADVSGYAHAREDALAAGLEEDGRRLVVHDGSVTAVPPGQVTPAGGDHFAVFTPYFRRWREQALRRPLPAPRSLRMPQIRTGRVPGAEALCDGSPSPSLPRGGEQEARRRLSAWGRGVQRYDEAQDALAEDGTSRLSPYLHFGCLSPTEVVHRIGAQSAGAQAFVRQVAWRDFHHQVLAARPETSRRDYRGHADRWRTDDKALDAWKNGRTGFPIVDAAMRQLLAEGWMHNRARLIVGSFLTKTLYLDWRQGADHFLDLLVDGDIANNQMNWQWVAGTGTDTRPHRVLNPVRQALQHDPDGAYVRRYVPELADVEGPAVHEPWKLGADVRRRLDYPDPIVDLTEGLHRFREARGRD